MNFDRLTNESKQKDAQIVDLRGAFALPLAWRQVTHGKELTEPSLLVLLSTMDIHICCNAHNSGKLQDHIRVFSKFFTES